jgi:eukaryotic-like serine/threonine-protein kinase
MSGAADRNLLLGIIALQMDFISRDDLIAAMNAWVLNKTTALSRILRDQGALTESRRSLLDALVEEHIKLHDNDPQKSLAAISSLGSICAHLSLIADPDVQASLPHLSAIRVDRDDDGLRTAPYPTVGDLTSAGARFRILRTHAKGGLGEVFVARDIELNRNIALKEIHDEFADDPRYRARFEFEAEVTGGLEHPSIVPVYGRGHTADGRPFYAMRFIRGDSLKEAIRRFHHVESQSRRDPSQRRLELRGLLGRFIDVCEAVGYAHSRGVLHRDIKPGNVMLGRYGETLVVDWGLAKTLEQPPEPKSEPESELPLRPTSGSAVEATQAGLAIGTPAYMSPEQAEGRLEHVGPKSDVYCLGATLYHLLTGHAPCEGDEIGELFRKVLAGDIPRPRKVNFRISAALEAICMKAMAYRPEKRYPSVAALQVDLERWLADEPVSAWREPFSHRTRRWLRRRRTAASSIATALVAATFGLAVVSVVQTEANSKLKSSNLNLALAIHQAQAANSDLEAANRALKEANDRERTRFDLALEAIKTFHGQVSEDLLLREKQFDDLRTKMLHGATAFYQRLEDLLKVRSDQHSRAALAQAYQDIGELTAKIGSQPDALAALKRGVELRLALAAEPGASQQAIRNASTSLIDVGNVQEGTGNLNDAMASYEQSRNLLEPLLISNPNGADDRAVMSKCLHGIARVQYLRGDASQALESHERALALRQELVTATPNATQLQSDLALSYQDIGWIHRVGGRAAEALAALEHARAIREQLTEADPTAIQFQRDLAQSYNDIGGLFIGMDRLPAALASFEHAREILKKLADAYPGVTRFEGDLARSYQGVGSVHQLTGSTAEALAAFDRARAILQRLADANPTLTFFQITLAICHAHMGHVRQKAMRPSDAVAEFEKSVGILERLSKLEPSGYNLYNLACFQSLLSGAAAQPGSGLTHDDARRLGGQAVATLRRAVAAGMEDVAFMRRDPDLDPIRMRPDFQLLLMDLDFPAESFAK